MSRWEKCLGRMLRSTRPVDFSYGEAATVVAALGFTLAPSGGSSHRKWRRKLDDGRVAMVELVERGAGPMKPYLVRDMIRVLKEHNLIPASLEP